MKKIEIGIIALFVLVFSACNCRNKTCNLDATLKMDSTIIVENYPTVELTITNNSIDTFLFPKNLRLENYQASNQELYFEVKYLNSKGKYRDIRSHSADYDYLSNNVKRINLAPNEVFKQKVQIDIICFDSKPGHYKMRAHFNLSEYNNCKKFTSNWVNFEIVDSASLFH